MNSGDTDVTAVLYVHWVISISGGAVDSGSAELVPGGAAIYLYNASSTFEMYVDADGSVEIERTGGLETADVLLQMLWI